jgi:predicted nucleic acid-binding protein
MNTEIGANVAPVIENPAELVVPTITIYEVYKELSAEKSEEYALNVVSYMQSGTIIDLNTALSISAARISREQKLAMADSIIYATSLHYSTVIFSCDKHFKDLPNVQYFQKTE